MVGMVDNVKRSGLGAFLVAASAVSALALTGCFSVNDVTCPEGFVDGVEYQMFFGLDDREGNRVSAEDWDAFLADTITPRFPAGMTIIDAHGQWQEPDGNIQREETILIRAVVAEPDYGSLRLVDEISSEYVRRFNQDPVFRVLRDDVCHGLGESGS